MGMAASQARLLSLTARIHDVEYQSQAIQNAKLQLATQSDRAYDDYNAALAETTLTINALDVGTGQTSLVAVNFNNLCSSNRLVAANGEQYAIRNKNGLLIVEDEIEEKYNEFLTSGRGSDAYTFALYMMPSQTSSTGTGEEGMSGINEGIVSEYELSVYNSLTPEEKAGVLEDTYNSMLRILKTYEEFAAVTNPFDPAPWNSMESMKDDKTKTEDERKKAESDYNEYESLLSKFKTELYKRYASRILGAAGGDSSNTLASEAEMAKFQYYVSIFKQIKACGGCISIEEYNSSLLENESAGKAATNTEWLQGMIQSGYFTIEMINTDEQTGEVSFRTTTPSSDSVLSYTTTTLIDNTALAKAEAEYEHTLRQIDKKDQKFDLDLSKLETERKALTTEYDSVKKVIQENIDRTFGIFS